MDELAFAIARISRGKDGDIMRVGIGVLIIAVELLLITSGFLVESRTIRVTLVITAICWICLSSTLMHRIIKASYDIEAKFKELDSGSKSNE